MDPGSAGVIFVLSVWGGIIISCCCWCLWCFWRVRGTLKGICFYKIMFPKMMIFTFSDEFGFGGGESHHSRQNREGVMDSHAGVGNSPATLNVNLATVTHQTQPQSVTNNNANSDPAPPYPESPPVNEQPPTYQDAIDKS